MSLVSLVKEKFGDREQFIAALFPKKAVDDKSYKEGCVVGKINSSFFDSCSSNLERSLYSVYGQGFSANKQVSDSELSYTFKKEPIEVNYSVLGTDRWHSENINREGKAEAFEWSNDIRIFLRLSEPVIDFRKVGIFFNNVLESHLVDYNPESKQKFGVFCSRTKYRPNKHGLKLLNAIDVKPNEAAEFFYAWVYGCYRYKKFSPEELNALGFC